MKTKKILIEKAVYATKLNEANCKGVIDSAVQTIVNTLKRGESITINGLGTFKVVERAGRTYRNPATGESITVSAHKAVKFTPCLALKNL